MSWESYMLSDKTRECARLENFSTLFWRRHDFCFSRGKLIF